MMKVMAIAALVSLLVVPAQGDDIEQALTAMWMVEAGGKLHPDCGDGGRARGPFQIWECYWQDGTRALGVDWPYSDADDLTRASKVVRAYVTHYQEAYDLPATYEVWCRIHNGGPRGFEKSCTEGYWQKCRAHLFAR